jgi:hypothetical protein
MNLEEYEALPDSMSHNDVHRYCMLALNEARSEDISRTLEKLDVLSDRQWHTYESPKPEFQSQLREWLIEHWISPNQDYLESVLSLSYCFALDKDIYRRALKDYSGEHVNEFQRHLEMSDGDTIDPWWSMKNKKA